MNVLSLFDGCSCGQVALERAGIKVDNYFSSEIDKHAIKVTMANYPDTIQLGDITQIDTSTLPKIDLLIGGSPCQGFSFAGNGLNFDDPRSKLFFDYVRVLNELKPKWFLLENVKMKKEYIDIISEQVKVNPFIINSSMVSAHNRERLYWTNIPTGYITDKYLFLKDIVEAGSGKLLTETTAKRPRTLRNFRRLDEKAFCMLATMYKGSQSNGMTVIDDGGLRCISPIECERLQTLPDNYTEIIKCENMVLYNNEEKNKSGEIICNAKLMDANERQLQKNMGNSVFYITKGLTDTELHNSLQNNLNPKKSVNIAIERLGKRAGVLEECVIDITKIGSDMATHYIQTQLETDLDRVDMLNVLTVKISTERYMKITLEENSKALRKYTIPILIKLIIQLKIYTYVKHKANIRFCIENLSESQDNLLRMELSDLKMDTITSLMSDTQRYKMLGNGWTVDVIAHIFKGLLNN